MIAGACLLCNQFEERCPACCTRASCALPSVPVLPVTTPTSLTPRCPFGKTEVSPAPAISPSARVASAYSCPEEMTRGKPDCATAAVSADNTIVTSDATGDDPIILVSSSCSEEPSTCVSSAARSFETVSLLDGNGTACWIFSPDAFKTFLYTCVATAETTEPAATPITDPAIPIFAESRNDVTAASAPAQIDEKEIPLKKFFTSHDDS